MDAPPAPARSPSTMEKAPLFPATEELKPRRPPPPPKRSSRFAATAFLLILGLLWLSRRWNCAHGHAHAETGAKVPLEIHIMSKCPDARDCLEKLVVPAMANVSDKVDFRLSFIGKTTEGDDGVQCPHGQTECLGDILELCAASEYPDPMIHLGFTMCLSHSYERIPKKELIQECALEHGIEFEKLNDCASKDDGSYGMGLLRESVTRSRRNLVSTSCTVRLDGKTRCVRDGGKWRDCEDGSEPEDLIEDIKRLYDEARGRAY